MERIRNRLFITCMMLVLLLTASGVGCSEQTDDDGGGGSGGSDGESGSGGGGDGSSTDELCPVVVSDADCDTSKRPFVFVHGTFGSGDNIANVAMLFGSNGYCQERFVAVEYNSLGGDPIAQLDELIDQVLADTGFDQVELAGHSQGTGHCGTYMSDPARAAKVAHYINYSGITVAPAEIPELALSSNNDLGGATILPVADNITGVNLGEEDHFAVAASRDAFVETWKFLYGEEPEYTTIQCGDKTVTVDGIAETFADNVPVSGTLEVYELDYDGDPRERGEPALVIHSDATGRSEPMQLKRNVPYEFKAFDQDGVLVGYVYFAPFKRSNRLIRLLKPSDNAMIASQSTDHLVRGPDTVAIVARYLGGAFRWDLDNTFKVNGEEMLTEENAGRNDSVVGFFMYDANQNGQTELGADFGPSTFLVGTDVYIDATEPAWISLKFHDPTSGEPPVAMKIPNWPSDQALILLYF